MLKKAAKFALRIFGLHATRAGDGYYIGHAPALIGGRLAQKLENP